jgi:hypothetical protein
MSTQFQPPPTYADPVVVDEATRKGQFNPIWLKWFLDLSQFINANGGGSAIQHNSLGGLQGGTTNQYYHLNQATYTILNNIGTPTAGSIAYGTGSTVAFSPVGSSGQVLTSGGTGSPTWSTPASGTITAVTATAPVASSGGTAPNISMPAATTSVSGYLTSTDWNTFNSKGSGTVTSVAALTLGTTGTDLSSSVANGTTTPVITLNVPTASATNRGALSAADWTTFNSKQPAGTYVNSVTGTSPVVSSGGVNPAISMPAATTSVSGYLTSTDWNTFNGKQPAGTYVTSVTGTSGRITSSGGTTPAIDLASGVATPGTTGSSTLVPVITIDTYGRVTSITTAANPQGTVTSVTGTAPVVSSGGATPAISMAAASASVNGYLTSTDWSTFNSKQPAGTYVTSVAVASSNGFAGTSSGGATPSLTLTTSITGVLYGNGTALAAATISAPLAYSAGTLSITQATTSTNGYLSSTDWNTFNNKGSGTVTSVTGTAPVVSSGGTTPAISMAAATTSVSGYLTSTDWNTFNNKQPAGSYLTAVTADAPLSGSGTSGSHLVISQATTSTNGYLSSTDWNTFNGKQPAGTYVTSVSVVSANGLAGTSSGGATPALTLSTTITGLLKGNGTAISAAVANTDYVPLSTVLTKTADYTITNTDTWIINNKTGSAMTLTFPAASSWTGRSITVKNMQAQLVNSASSNIVPIDSTTAGTAILLAVIGNWATLVSDGTNWVIMQAASNNNLLLE